MSKIRGEMSFVTTLREELKSITSEKIRAQTNQGGFYMSDSTLLTLVGRPTVTENEIIQTLTTAVPHVRDNWMRAKWSADATPRCGEIFLPKVLHHPYVYVGLHVSAADLEWGMPDDVEGLSYVLNPDMSLARGCAGGPLRYQPGTCDIIPFAVKTFGETCDDVLFRGPGSLKASPVDIINSHRTSNADVTCVLTTDKVRAQPVLVSVNGILELRDTRDLPDDLDTSDAGYHSSGSFVVSMKHLKNLLANGMPLSAWRRRRIHKNNEITVRFERHLHELANIGGKIHYIVG